MWNLVAADELVDRVASDTQQACGVLDIEDAVAARLVVVRRADG
jgi:hypothetical protein